MTYPNGLDGSGDIFRSYRFTYQPNTVLVTRAGRVFNKTVGKVGESRLRSLLDELIREA